jgi:hypothetical protein
VIYPGRLTARDTFRVGSIGDVHPGDIAALASIVAQEVLVGMPKRLIKDSTWVNSMGSRLMPLTNVEATPAPNPAVLDGRLPVGLRPSPSSTGGRPAASIHSDGSSR